MRLILIFDNTTNISFKKNDIVISENKIIDNSLCEINNYLFPKHPNHYNINEINNIKNEFLSRAKNKIEEDVINGSFNDFNRKWIFPFLGIIELINNIISNNKISQVLIYGYTSSMNTVTFYEAEGERNKRLLYNTSDVFPFHINNYFKSININPTIFSKKNRNLVVIRFFFRKYLLLIYKLIINLYRKLIHDLSNLFVSNKDEIIANNVVNMFCSRGVAHTKYVYKFIEENVNSILFISDGIFSKGKNYKFVMNNNISNHVRDINYISYKNIFWSFLKSLYYSSNQKSFNVEIKGQKICFNNGVSEMIIAYFDVQIYKSALNNFISNKSKLINLLSLEMYTAFAYVTNSVGKENSLKTYQIQSTAMMSRLEPNFVYCDKFLLKTESEKKVFRKLYNSNKFDFFGTFNDVFEFDYDLTKNKPKNILFFSQPDNLELEKKLLIQILKISDEYEFKVSIKLHPRDSNDKFKEITNNDVTVYDGYYNFTTYKSNFDLAIVRTTSLSHDLILEGVPVIFCLFNDSDVNSPFLYLDKKFYGTIFNQDGFYRIFDNYQMFINKYRNYREKYLADNDFNKGRSFFYNSLHK